MSISVEGKEEQVLESIKKNEANVSHLSLSIEEKVKSIIVDQLAVEEEKVVPSALFVDDLGADSLDMVELVMTMEEAFELKIQEEAAQKLRTVGDVIQFISANVAQSTH